MESVGYGILIAFLMGLSAFGGAYLALKFKGISDIRMLQWGNDTGDEEVEEKIRAAGHPKVFNIEDIPPAEQYYARQGASEELKRATAPK